MSDEVRDMIRSALADEPASGLEFERVVRDGRKRRARRRFGVLTATATGVVAVVAVTVSGAFTPTSAPAADALSTTPTTSATSSAAPTPQGCAASRMTGGFPDLPRGSATPEELAESGRLTEAFGRFALPLPAGVEATPLRLCAIDESWGGDFRLTGDRVAIVYVRPLGGQPPGECVRFTPETQCSVRALPDGSTARLTVEPTGDTTLVTADVWRSDGTYVSVMETGGMGSKNRVFDDDGLLAIATAPQLRVRWTGRPVPAAPSDRRAAELDRVLAGVLPAGVEVEPTPAGEALDFRVRQGGYRAVANLADAAGRGWVMVTVDEPNGGEVDCGGRPDCRLVGLSNGRQGALDTLTTGGLTRLSLHAKAADGSRIGVHTANGADDGTGPDRPTRPSPLLTEADLIRIAELPDLHW
ncbi:hypothetical protein FHX81_2106 [Saccharothrix saharensis]|uniref:Uncharacterized protein n=1 Tax=Saccharothrix saharensis TaxID=571190 RepID=A0A543JAF5_9PSEU|nr:hypothetical protein [Saccharothrix saharensis]TQM79796.1 hypothetical protein FHX81_2106 [Saccharothrix saharensis]